MFRRLYLNKRPILEITPMLEFLPFPRPYELQLGVAQVGRVTSCERFSRPARCFLHRKFFLQISSGPPTKLRHLCTPSQERGSSNPG